MNIKNKLRVKYQDIMKNKNQSFTKFVESNV